MGNGRASTFEYIDQDGDRLAVSMIEWGVLRRLMVALLHKISKPNRYESRLFSFRSSSLPSSARTRCASRSCWSIFPTKLWPGADGRP